MGGDADADVAPAGPAGSSRGRARGESTGWCGTGGAETNMLQDSVATFYGGATQVEEERER